MGKNTKRNKRVRRRAGEQELIDSGYRHQWKSKFHVVITVKGQRWDFWPSTGTWGRMVKGSITQYFKGIQLLLADIKQNTN